MAKNGRFTRITTQDKFVTEKIDVIQNNLLGSYDDDGNYSLAPKIVQELLSLRKLKRATFANSVFCVGSLLGYGELVFELLFDSKTHNGKSASATLYLLEDVDKINGYLQNTLKTKLEDFNDEVENFIQETYKHFNIDTSEDEEEDDAEVLERKLKDDLENEDSFILAKKQYSLMLEKLLEDKFLDAYGKYFTSRISTLTKLDNDFSQAVITSFNRQYELIHNVFLQEKNYKILNELLDKCFEEVSGTSAQFVLQENEYNKAIAPSLETFVSNVNKLNQKFEHKALHMLGKEDRKKVEQILDDQVEKETLDTESESQHSVEHIVNNIPRNTYTLKREQPVVEETKESTEPVVTEKPKTVDSEEKHFIEEIMLKGAHKEEQKTSMSAPEQPQQNFYTAFRESHISAYSSQPSKVVNTSLSEHLDTPVEEVAAISLKDRISRLEKFKQNSATINTTDTPDMAGDASELNKEDETVGNLFDTLSKEKLKKDIQFDLKNRRTRAEIDNIAPQFDFDMEEEQMSQREREERLRNQDLYKDYSEMEK